MTITHLYRYSVKILSCTHSRRDIGGHEGGTDGLGVFESLVGAV